MPATFMSRTEPSTATSGTFAPRWRRPAARPRSRRSMASASNWGVARHRVDRGFGSDAAEVAALAQPDRLCGFERGAFAAAVQPLLPESLPERTDPADRVRTDCAERGAGRGL